MFPGNCFVHWQFIQKKGESVCQWCKWKRWKNKEKVKWLISLTRLSVEWFTGYNLLERDSVGQKKLSILDRLELILLTGVRWTQNWEMKWNEVDWVDQVESLKQCMCLVVVSIIIVVLVVVLLLIISLTESCCCRFSVLYLWHKGWQRMSKLCPCHLWPHIRICLHQIHSPSGSIGILKLGRNWHGE